MAKVKFRILEFKSISPFFEQEKDGSKPFIVLQWHTKDSRFRALALWDLACRRKGHKPDWLIKLTNPATGEYFYCRLEDVVYFPGQTGQGPMNDWLILYLGKEIKEE